MPIKCNSTFGFKIENSSIKSSVEIWIDTFNGIENSDADFKIFVCIEPNEIIKINNYIKNLSNKFDYVFAYDVDLLSSIKNSVLFEYGTKWVEIEKYGYPNKKFSISTVCGSKSYTQNHLIRKKLWYKQDKIKNPIDFYLSKQGGVENFRNNKLLGESKFPLFDSMFHICIENVTKDNFFTEKLIDCLLCETIPIYLGCKNIGNYFNTNSIISVDNLDEIIYVCNNLKEEDYYSKIDSVIENKNKSFDWVDFPKRIEDKIKDLGIL